LTLRLRRISAADGRPHTSAYVSIR
jgi:hypothetical protein